MVNNRYKVWSLYFLIGLISVIVSDAEIYVYSVTANLDPEEFYNRNVGKELYMSDQSSPDNNIFVFRIQISIENQCYWKDVYRFRTKTKGKKVVC